MTKQELIYQIKSIIENAEDFLDDNEPNSVWHKDIEAMIICLDLVEKHYVEPKTIGNEN